MKQKALRLIFSIACLSFTYFLATCLHFPHVLRRFSRSGAQTFETQPEKASNPLYGVAFRCFPWFSLIFLRFCFHFQASQGRRHPLTRNQPSSRSRKRSESTLGPAQIDPRTGPKVDQNRPERSTKKLKKVIEKVDFLMLRWCQDDVKMMPRWWLKNDEKLVFSKMIEKNSKPSYLISYEEKRLLEFSQSDSSCKRLHHWFQRH